MERSVKQWRSLLPTVDVARPRRCPRCGAAGQPAGAALGILGHGLRTRQMWGPLEAGGLAEACEVVLRRYVCVACAAVLTVGPRGLRRRHLYTAASIALALWLWSQRRWPAKRVRARVSPWRVHGACGAERWRSLLRWAGSRERAARHSQHALALGDVGPDMESVVMDGGAHLG